MVERREVKVRSAQVWARVREAYVQGEPAKSVARRFDVGEANLRYRAKTQGWTRKRMAELAEEALVEGGAPTPDQEPERAVAPMVAVEMALGRAAWLVSEGRAGEAQALMRAAEQLGRLTGVSEVFGFGPPANRT